MFGVRTEVGTVRTVLAFSAEHMFGVRTVLERVRTVLERVRTVHATSANSRFGVRTETREVRTEIPHELNYVWGPDWNGLIRILST